MSIVDWCGIAVIKGTEGPSRKDIVWYEATHKWGQYQYRIRPKTRYTVTAVAGKEVTGCDVS